MGEVAKVADDCAEGEIDAGLAVEHFEEKDHDAHDAGNVHQDNLAVEVFEVRQKAIDEKCEEEKEKTEASKGRVDCQLDLFFWHQLEILQRTSQHNVASFGEVFIVLVVEAIVTGEGVVHVVQAAVRGEVPLVQVRVQGVDGGAPGDEVLRSPASLAWVISPGYNVGPPDHGSICHLQHLVRSPEHPLIWDVSALVILAKHLVQGATLLKTG